MKIRTMAVIAAVCLMVASSAHAGLKDNGDGTITDTGQNLVWLKNANCFGMKNFFAAKDSAAGLGSGACGLADKSTAGQWRLPTKEELQLRSQNTNGFLNFRGGWYWSRSSGYGHGVAYSVEMTAARASFDVQNSGNFVWPVRGVQ